MSTNSLHSRTFSRRLSGEEKRNSLRLRENYSLKADEIIQPLFNKAAGKEKLFEGLEKLSVLVPGAGVFPSFVSFSRAVIKHTSTKKNRI